MSKCDHDNCFTCPYPDCIVDGKIKKNRVKMRRKLTAEEAKRHRAENNKRYYEKNRDKFSELHRQNYQRRKAKKQSDG